jgi:hypothetical protein
MMKSEPRPFASLSSGLLARKGAARPAMRPQGFGQMGSGLDDLGWNDMGFEPPRPTLAPVGSEEAEPAPLRVNPAAGLTPASPVHAVQEELVQRLGQDGAEEDLLDDTAEPVAADAPPLAELLTRSGEVEEPQTVPAAVMPVPAPAPVQRAKSAPRARREAGAKGKAAFTLRLDSARHLKLRLACAVTGTSAQQLVTRALDELLATMPELDAMAERAPERRASKR